MDKRFKKEAQYRQAAIKMGQFDAAKKIFEETGSTSTGSLQLRLGITFERAKLLQDMLAEI